MGHKSVVRQVCCLVTIFALLTYGAFIVWTASLSVPAVQGGCLRHGHHCRQRSSSSGNSARLSAAYDPYTELVVNATDRDKLHVITNFFVVTHPAFNGDLAALDVTSSDYAKVLSRLKTRLDELTTTLQRNLRHSRVALVHVIYSHPYVSYYLMRLKLAYSGRLVLHLVQGQLTYEHAFAYAYEHLPNRLVAVTNQDIFLGDGWHLVNATAMAQHRLMYALTRHPGNASCPDDFTCEYTKRYMGSHDTFAFYAHGDANVTALREMRLRSDALGIENVLISVYRYKLDYHVINPCRVIKTHHLHCSNVHNRLRMRVNTRTTTGMASFSSSLY